VRSYPNQHVRSYADNVDSNVVEVYIGYLRRKLDQPFGLASIETVRGVGYRLVDAAGPAGAQLAATPGASPLVERGSQAAAADT